MERWTTPLSIQCWGGGSPAPTRFGPSKWVRPNGAFRPVPVHFCSAAIIPRPMKRWHYFSCNRIILTGTEHKYKLIFLFALYLLQLELLKKECSSFFPPMNQTNNNIRWITARDRTWNEFDWLSGLPSTDESLTGPLEKHMWSSREFHENILKLPVCAFLGPCFLVFYAFCFRHKLFQCISLAVAKLKGSTYRRPAAI